MKILAKPERKKRSTQQIVQIARAVTEPEATCEPGKYVMLRFSLPARNARKPAAEHPYKLVVLDEIHLVPDLSAVLGGLIDRGATARRGQGGILGELELSGQKRIRHHRAITGSPGRG